MLLFNYQIGIKFKMPKINIEDRMRKIKKTPEYQATIRRSLHYFFEVNKKYKWYNLAILAGEPPFLQPTNFWSRVHERHY